MPMWKVDASREAINFRFLPLDWKCKGRVQDHIEVVISCGVFPEVISRDGQVPVHGLLETHVEHVAPCRGDRLLPESSEDPLRKSALSSRTRKDEVFVVDRK